MPALLAAVALLSAAPTSALRLLQGHVEQHRPVTRRNVLTCFGAASIAGVASSGWAEDTVIIGQVPASGIIFKDIVKVERIQDPKVCLWRPTLRNDAKEAKC